MLKAVVLVVIYGCLAFAKDEDMIVDETIQQIEKRTVAVGTSLEAAILPGTSLQGTSVEGLKTKGYTVQLYGSIENFSRWTMYSKGCEVKNGQSTHAMVNVGPGKKEGFASTKTSSSWHGTWQYCRFNMAGRTIHIMWDIPYSRTFHANYLTIGISALGVDSTAKKMYYSPPSYAIKKQFYYDTKPIRICAPDFCIKAVVGTGAIVKMTVKLYPTHFLATAPSVQLSLKHLVNPAGAWYDFMANEFGIVYRKVIPVRPVPQTVAYRDEKRQ